MSNTHNEDNVWFRGDVSFPKHSRNTSLPSKRIQNLDDTLNKLQETGRKLEENNMKLDDILNTLEENNRKLDDTLNTLEENNRKLEAIAERLEKRKMSKNTHLQKPPELL
jgi:DNA repair ATPase RecN